MLQSQHHQELGIIFDNDHCIRNWDCLIVGEPVPLRLQLHVLQRGQGVRSEVQIKKFDELGVSHWNQQWC